MSETSERGVTRSTACARSVRSDVSACASRRVAGVDPVVVGTAPVLGAAGGEVRRPGLVTVGRCLFCHDLGLLCRLGLALRGEVLDGLLRDLLGVDDIDIRRGIGGDLVGGELRLDDLRFDDLGLDLVADDILIVDVVLVVGRNHHAHLRGGVSEDAEARRVDGAGIGENPVLRFFFG